MCVGETGVGERRRAPEPGRPAAALRPLSPSAFDEAFAGEALEVLAHRHCRMPQALGQRVGRHRAVALDEGEHGGAARGRFGESTSNY